MTHNRRLDWLKSLGFTERGSFNVPEIGLSAWMSGVRLGIDESFWLSARDGSAIIHGENTPLKTWQELQAWIQEQPERKKPLAAQRNLFGDEE